MANHGRSRTILSCFPGLFFPLSGLFAAILLSANRPPIKVSQAAAALLSMSNPRALRRSP